MGTTEDTLALVRAYHRGWSSRAFDDALRLLSPGLEVETPINEYPTMESFGRALVGFGGMTRSVWVLAEFARGGEAMLLYDMDVESLGTLRVAEHFTVSDGRIVRIRQIHDTAALRQAGFARQQERKEHMTTRDTVEGYFGRLERKDGWETLLADDIVFTSLTSPVKRISGRAAYLEATKPFYATIASVQVRDVIVDGQRACALTRYRLQRPGGAAFQSDVAEVFGVRDGKISSLDIYFDTAPFPK